MTELRRSLGVGRGTAMMLNIVLGAGLLTLPGLAHEAVGGAAPLVWLACALAAAPLLLVFAILGRRHADAGGLATIMGRAFGASGRVPATFLFLGAVGVGLPAIALTGGHYAAAAIGGAPPLYAAGLIVAALAVNLLAAEVAARVNTAVASLVILVILGLAAAGWMAVTPDPGAVAAGAMAGWPGLPAFGLTFMMVFFAFTGWEVSANLGEEFRNPGRDLPLAMAASFAIAVALYLVLAIIVAAAGDAGAGPAPFARIFGEAFGPTAARAVSAVSVLLIFANLSAAIWAVSRMVYASAREGLLPPILARLRRGLPLAAVALTVAVLLAVVTMAALELVDLGRLLAAAGQNFLLLYGGAAAALLRLADRAWQAWLGAVGLAIVAALLVGRGGEGGLYPAVLILAGLGLAALRMRQRNPA